MSDAEAISEILSQHVQSARNQRCICGWRPDYTKGDNLSGWTIYKQHRDHVAQILVAAGFGRK